MGGVETPLELARNLIVIRGGHRGMGVCCASAPWRGCFHGGGNCTLLT